MSIKAAILTGVNKAFEVLNEFQTTLLFRQYHLSPTHTQILTEISLIGIFTDFTEFERNHLNIDFSSKKLICQAALFGATVPNVTGTFTINSKKWLIGSLELDPSGTIYTFQLDK